MEDAAKPVVVRPHGPSDVASALLDVSQPFDDDLLERLNGWIAGTSGTPYDPPPPRSVSPDESTALSSSIWPSASFRAPVTEAGAPASSPSRTPVAVPSVSVQWSPPRLGRRTPASASSTFGLLAGEPRQMLPDGEDASPVVATVRSQAQSHVAYRTEVFDFPTGAVLGDVVLVQARYRGWKAQRFANRYRRFVARRMFHETAHTYQAWQMLTHATRTRLKALKRAAFFALRDYTHLTVDLFNSVAVYLQKMLGRTEYSASSMWNLAQRKPVPGLEHLSTMPTYLYTAVNSRLYTEYSKRVFKRLKMNLRYWKGKLAAAKGMWKASFRQRSRAVLIVWFRYGKLIIAERTLQSLPIFEEQLPEWDICIENYMKTASTMRKVAGLSVQNVIRRSFRRLQVYLGRPGSNSQQQYAEEYFMQYGKRQCLEAWQELKNRRRAEHFFFQIVFRRWRRQARDAFYSLRMLERQLFKWVCQRNCRRCFRAMQAYKDYSLMMSYAATQRIRSPNEHALVLKAVFQWQGRSWHVAMVHCWDCWRKFTRMRRAFSAFVTRHGIARRYELLLISFLAFHRHYRSAFKAAEKDAREAAAVAGNDPKAVQCKQVGPLDQKYKMDACEDHGEVDAKTVEQAIEQFPDDDFDTAIQHHRKIHFAQWKQTLDKSLFKRVVTLQMHQQRVTVQAEVEQRTSALASSQLVKDRPTEKQRLIDAKIAMKAAEQKFGTREEAELYFRRELQYATEVRSSAENNHSDIIARHAFRFEDTDVEPNSTVVESKPKRTTKKTKKKDPYAAVQVSTEASAETGVDCSPIVGATQQKSHTEPGVREGADQRAVSYGAKGDANHEDGNSNLPKQQTVDFLSTRELAVNEQPQSVAGHAYHTSSIEKSMESGQASSPNQTPTNNEASQQIPIEHSASSVLRTEDQQSQQLRLHSAGSHEGAHAPPELRSDIMPVAAPPKRKSTKKSRAKRKTKVTVPERPSGDGKSQPTSQNTVAIPETELSNATPQETAIEHPTEPNVDVQYDALAVDAVQSMAGNQSLTEKPQQQGKEQVLATTNSLPEQPAQQNSKDTLLTSDEHSLQRKLDLSPVDTSTSESAAIINTEEVSPAPVLTQDLVFREPDTFNDADIMIGNAPHTNGLGSSFEELEAHDSGDWSIDAHGLGSGRVNVMGSAEGLPDDFANTNDSQVGGVERSSRPSAVVDIEVPEGVEPGELTIVHTSDGKKIEVTVPQWMGPGDVFKATVAVQENDADRRPEIVQFTNPPYAKPGHVVAATCAHSGREVEMIVPEGLNPGDTFPVAVAREVEMEPRIGLSVLTDSEGAGPDVPNVYTGLHDSPIEGREHITEDISDVWGPSEGPTQTQKTPAAENKSERPLESEPVNRHSLAAEQQARASNEHASKMSSQQPAESFGQEIPREHTEHLSEFNPNDTATAPDAESSFEKQSSNDPRRASDADNERSRRGPAGSADTTQKTSPGSFVADVPDKPAARVCEKTDNSPNKQSNPTDIKKIAARRDAPGQKEPTVLPANQEQKESREEVEEAHQEAEEAHQELQQQHQQQQRLDEDSSGPESDIAGEIFAQKSVEAGRMGPADNQSERGAAQNSAESERHMPQSTDRVSNMVAAQRNSAGTTDLPQHRDDEASKSVEVNTMDKPVPTPVQEQSLGDPGAAASRALQREDSTVAQLTTAADTFSGGSILDISSEELDAIRRNEQELLQRLKGIAHSNRELDKVDEDKIKNFLEQDLRKFKGPDIYERNTYRAKINEQALKSRVRKDQLYWLYQQAELALERHASEVSHIPLDKFRIPVTGPAGFSRDQPIIDIGHRDERPSSTYDNLASYFTQVKEHLAARGQQSAETGWGDRPSTVAGSQRVAEEMSQLSSRFPSLAQRAPASRTRSRPSTVGDGRRSRDANSREGRTTHAADISNAAVSAWANASGTSWSESYLYSADGSAAMDPKCVGVLPDCSHPLHSSMSCPECGSAQHIAEVDMHIPSTGALTAVSLNRLREKAEDPSKYHLDHTIDGEEAPSHLTKAEQEEEFRRAHFGGGGAAGRSCQQHGRPRAGLTPGISRPSLATGPVLLPPLETDLQLTGMSQSQSTVTVGSDLGGESGSVLQSASQVLLASHDGSQPNIHRRKQRKKKSWKSPYRQNDEGDADGLRPLRTTPSFGGGDDDISNFEMSGAGLRVPPHLLDLIGHVEDMLDNGDVEAALDHITSSFVGKT